MTQEILTMEQLESVSGGSWSETKVDTAFLMQLDYSITNTITIKKAFAENGIDFENYPSPLNNDYSIKGQKYPHWAALGYVLKKRNYAGFNGNWTDSNYTKSFLKEHFHIRNV